MAGILLDQVTKRFGALAAVNDVTLAIADREFVTLLGPSGCGKTTLLRLLAGFATPDAGSIQVDGRVLSTKTAVVPPERRGMGMVFQNYAVWPHKTVYENVVFGLDVRGVSGTDARVRVGKVLEAVNLSGLEDRYPNQLSGGQQQRVALARSLVVEPSILLLDEPLSNLDAKLRERMRWELKDLQRRTGITFVYVTHDQSEAMALSDRIAVMHEGRLQQCGPPREVYARPANRTVADFMGLVNLLSGRVTRAAGDASVVTVGGAHALEVALPAGAREGQAIQVAIRPESIRLAPLPDAPAKPPPDGIAATVAEVTFLGNLIDCHVTLDDGTRVRVQAESEAWFEVGQRVVVRLDSRCCTVFEDNQVGGPDMAPHTPLTLGSAAAKPWRSSA